MKYIVSMQLAKTDTVEYGYNAGRYNIFLTAQQWLKYYINLSLHSEETTHTSIQWGGFSL